MIDVSKNYSMPSGRQITIISVGSTEVTYEVAGCKTSKPFQKSIKEFLIMTR